MRLWPTLAIACSCAPPLPPAPLSPRAPPRPTCTAGAVAGATGHGSIHASAADLESGQPLAGVTAVAIAPGATAAVEIGDDRGGLTLDVPPGTYVVKLYYKGVVTGQPCVRVAAGAVTEMSLVIDTVGDGAVDERACADGFVAGAARTVPVRGTVIDRFTRAPHRYALVNARPSGGGTAIVAPPEDDGEFALDLVPGTYEVTASDAATSVRCVRIPAAALVNLILQIDPSNANDE